MSTPAQGPVRNTVNRVAAGVSRWRNTRRGTSTLKASYAQAARDVKRMDPAVRQAIGRSNLTKADLQVLAEAQVVGGFNPGEQPFAQLLSDRATARVEAVGASAPPTRNPVRMVGNRISRWRDTRQGTARLKAAYAQAARDVKRTDPAIREAIGRSRINKSDLTNFSKTQIEATFRPEGRQLPGQPQGQAQAASAGGQPGRAARLGARLGGAVGSVSRWAKEVRSKTTTAAQQFSAAYTARRQNPAARNQTPQRTTWTAPGQQPNQVATPTQPTPIQATPAQATPTQATPTQAAPVQPTPAPATPTQATPAPATPAQAAPAQVAVPSSAAKPEGLVAFKADTSRASAAAFSGTAGDPAQAGSTSDPRLSPSQHAGVEGQTTGARMDEDPQQALAGNAPPGSATPADPAKPATNLGEATGSTSHNKHRKPDSREV